jgi:hypothetical protein
MIIGCGSWSRNFVPEFPGALGAWRRAEWLSEVVGLEGEGN